MNRLGVVVVSALCALTSGAAEMKLMSFNVCHCSGMDGKIDIARTAARIRAEDPDFACLQELDWYTARSGVVDQPAELSRLTGLHATFAKAIFFQGGQYGVMMLSREKPANVVQVPLPGREPRVLLLCEFADCVVGTTHLSVSAEAERAESIDLIRNAIAPFVGRKPVFLTGDWNSTPQSTVMRGLDAFLKVVSKTDCQTFHGRQLDGPDGMPRDMSRYCIDYIACDTAHAGSFGVVDAHVVEDRVTSDHAPIVVTLETPDRAAPRPALVPIPVKLTTKAGMCRVQAGAVTEVVFVKRAVDASLPKGGYRLEIGEAGVSVTAADDAGFFHALQTLKQLAYSSWGRLAFPCCEIEDAPAFRWRGVHWDDSRHFFGKTAVKRALDLMAQHKFNVFHWHLTDNQGWRLPVDRYPEMTDKAARRSYSKDRRYLLDEKPEGAPGEYGPFAYTKDEIREVIAYAKARFIRVIPEVEIPGHARSTFYAHPELLCFADDSAAKPTNAVDNVYCVGNPKTYEFLENVLDEVCELFPDPVVHIGGDEVKKANWVACPKCRAKMREFGVTTPEELQARVNGHFADYLTKKGKQAIWWGEIPERDVPKNLKVMSWLGAECGIAAAKKGIEAVMCEHFYTYFDYTPCIEGDTRVYPWFTERLPLSKVYAYDPLKGIPAEFHKYILGGECCNWTEYTCTEKDLDWKLWTRACALSEVLWTGVSRPGYADFCDRMRIHRQRLVDRGVNCSPVE